MTWFIPVTASARLTTANMGATMFYKIMTALALTVGLSGCGYERTETCNKYLDYVVVTKVRGLGQDETHIFSKSMCVDSLIEYKPR